MWVGSSRCGFNLTTRSDRHDNCAHPCPKPSGTRLNGLLPILLTIALKCTSSNPPHQGGSNEKILARAGYGGNNCARTRPNLYGAVQLRKQKRRLVVSRFRHHCPG